MKKLTVLFIAITRLLSPENKSTTNKYIERIAFLFVLIGIFGFFGSALSSLGAMNWLPKSFEWPIKYTSTAAKTNDGFYIVPHSPSGRIQIYDEKLKFIRGWPVYASGGVFKLNISENNLINAYTARGQWHYIFNLNGDLISKEKFTPKTYDAFNSAGVYLSIPIAPWLIVFSHPFYSWILAIIGMIILIKLDKIMKRKKTS